MLGQRRLGEVHPQSGTAEAALFHESYKGFHLLQCNIFKIMTIHMGAIS